MISNRKAGTNPEVQASRSDYWSNRVPVAFFPNRPFRKMRTWFAVVIASMLVLYGAVVPATADLAIMQAFADAMGRVIPGLDEAAAVTDFEKQARLMLALDRALLFVWPLLGMLLNLGVLMPRNHHPHPLLQIAAAVPFVAVTIYSAAFPHVPDPPNPDLLIERKNLYPLMTSGLPGFAFVHGGFSLVCAAMLNLILLTFVRFPALQRARREWLRR